MTINEYLQKNYETLIQKVRAITRGHQNSDDLLNDCIIDLIDKGPDYINQILQDNKVDRYILKMCYTQYNSSTSPFYTKYRKQKWEEIEEEKIEIEDKEEIYEDIEKLGKDIKLYIGKLPFYQKELATKHFVEGQSQRDMSKTYNINRIHISRDIKTIKKNLHMTFSREKYKTK